MTIFDMGALGAVLGVVFALLVAVWLVTYQLKKHNDIGDSSCGRITYGKAFEVTAFRDNVKASFDIDEERGAL